MVDDVLRYKRLDGVQEALTTVAAAMYPSGNQTAVLTGQLDRLTVPVLVVWGEQDLPERIDPDRDAELLRGFDLDPAALVETFGGQSPEVG
jgi:pyruvate dehydrogenase E2 component (dihydrolipoamide acetyltransferase)